MDSFSSVLRQLSTQLSKTYEEECEKRRALERELTKAKMELEQARQMARTPNGENPPGKEHTSDDSASDTNVENNDTVRNTGGANRTDIDGSGMMSAEVIEFAEQGSQESEELPAQRPRKKRVTEISSHNWHESDVREFAMMKGWKTLEAKKGKFEKLDSRRSNSTEFVISMFSGGFKKKEKSKCEIMAIKIVESHAFDCMSVVAILLNSFLIGLIGNYAARHRLLASQIPTGFLVAERIFTVIFTMELLTRMGAYRCEFFCGVHRSWHIFDLLVVGADILQTILEEIVTDTGVDLSILRVVRIVRVTRAVRVIKVIRFFKELRMMIYSILRCGTSLLWSLILFLTITYIFGVFLMSQVTDFMALNGETHHRAHRFEEYFGSVAETIYTLYSCMSGGISWKEISDDLLDIHWTNAFALCFYVFFTLFVVANILTGIFVDTAIQSAASDRDEIIQEQMANQESELMTLKKFFEDADKDESGTISMDEFKDHLQSNTVRLHFEQIGIQVRQAMGLFKLLDQDKSGEIGIEEFIMGCMRLKGGARGIDLATLMYENKRLVEKIRDLEITCVEEFKNIVDFHGSLHAWIKQHGDPSFMDEGGSVPIKPPRTSCQFQNRAEMRKSQKVRTSQVGLSEVFV